MDLQALLPVFMSWAVHLSGYPAPAEMPTVQFEPHAFFVQQVCGGKECNAVGWYNDRNIVYVDDKYEHVQNDFANSLVVHELIHYLQHQSGKFDSLSCTDSVAREREAYAVQNQYILKSQGSFALIKPAPTFCNYGHAAAEPHEH